ncbi:hypothetical protein SEA_WILLIAMSTRONG_31 [Microbacterium phage WilliamStrong]|nr:hypothetical protein SEA_WILLIAMSTRONG_31 [Microbacterium phage WilliamStrong]
MIMQYPTLPQLAKMTPEQRTQRLRGIDEVSRTRLLVQAAELVGSISNAELRLQQTAC